MAKHHSDCKVFASSTASINFKSLLSLLSVLSLLR
jgi:hypothetical protein